MQEQLIFTLAALRAGTSALAAAINLAFSPRTGHGLSFCDCPDKMSVQPVQVAARQENPQQPTPFEGRDPQRSMPLKGREDFTESTEGQRRCKKSTDVKSHNDAMKEDFKETEDKIGQRRCENSTEREEPHRCDERRV